MIGKNLGFYTAASTLSPSSSTRAAADVYFSREMLDFLCDVIWSWRCHIESERVLIPGHSFVSTLMMTISV